MVMKASLKEMNIRVIPNASQNIVVGWHEGSLKIKIMAVPEDGKANRAIITFLAKLSGCSKREIEIIKGEKSRNKTIRFLKKDLLTDWIPPMIAE